MASTGDHVLCAAGIALFARAELPAPEKMRPLGSLSNFVVDELPSLLEEIRRGEIHAAQLSGGADISCLPPTQDLPEDERPLACLDLMLLQQACDHVGATFPAYLRGPAAEICRSLGRIETLLYEDSVLANPLTRDPRVFTRGDAGRIERDFLLAHTLIESCLQDVNRRVREILSRVEEHRYHGSDAVGQAVHEHCSSILAGMQQVRDLFLSMRRMRRDEFQSFRGYYMPSPRTCHPGPSGRFSAKFFLLRVLVEGSAIRHQIPTFYREILDLFDYFPRGEREVLSSFILPEYLAGNRLSVGSRRVLETFGARRGDRVPSLRDASLEPWARSTGLPDLTAALREDLDACTAIHLGLVHKNITDQREGGRASSAGSVMSHEP